MNLFALSGLLIGISSLSFGFFVFSKNPKNKTHWLWLVFSLAVAAWEFGVYKIGITTDKETAFFWWRVAHIGVIFIPVFFSHFIYEWLKIKKRFFFYFTYIFAFFFSFINLYDLLIKPTGLFIANMRWVFDSFFYDSPPGQLYTFYTILWLFIILYAHYELIKVYKKSVGVKRNQIRYFIFAFVVAYSGGATAYFPVFGIDIYPYLNFTVPFYPMIMAYAIVRYRLMDIKVGIRKSFIYFFLGSFAYMIFYTTAFLYRFAWGDVFAKEGYIVGIFIALAFAVLFLLLIKVSQNFVNKYLYVSVYNTQTTLENLAHELNHLIKLSEVIDSIVDTIMQTLGLDRSGVLLHDLETKKYNIAKIIGFDKNNGISLVQDNFLTEWLKKTGEPLIYNELELAIDDTKNIKTKENLKKIKENMKHIEAGFCLPLLTRGELIGMIVLGNKLNNEAYSKGDVDLLKFVAAQASVAISNAQFYNEMESIVKSQTKELREKNTNLEQLNKDLKETLDAKSNFLTVASHQLRTPTSVIKGMLGMIMDEGVPKDKKNDFIKRCAVQTDRLSNTIHDLLSASAIEGKGFELNIKPTNIDELITKIVKERRMKLEQNNDQKKRNVKLVYKQPKTVTPPINIDPNKITEVVANLIDNAIHYTLKGKIEITTKTDDKNFSFTIKDTGIGISKEDMPKLFKQIARLPNAIQVCPDGTGLGLFIVKGMVEKHGGKVDVQCNKDEKGSTFTFWIPKS